MISEAERQEIFKITEVSYNHLYFGNGVYGGRLENSTKIFTRDDGIVMRKLVFYPSPELIGRYKLDKNKDANVQGLVILWVPDNWIEPDMAEDAQLGRRMLVYCDYNLEPTKLMKRISGQLNNDAFYLGQIHNATAKIIQLQEKELRIGRNPDVDDEKYFKKIRLFSEALGHGGPASKGQLPPEI